MSRRPLLAPFHLLLLGYLAFATASPLSAAMSERSISLTVRQAGAAGYQPLGSLDEKQDIRRHDPPWQVLSHLLPGWEENVLEKRGARLATVCSREDRKMDRAMLEAGVGLLFFSETHGNAGELYQESFREVAGSLRLPPSYKAFLEQTDKEDLLSKLPQEPACFYQLMRIVVGMEDRPPSLHIISFVHELWEEKVKSSLDRLAAAITGLVRRDAYGYSGGPDSLHEPLPEPITRQVGCFLGALFFPEQDLAPLQAWVDHYPLDGFMYRCLEPLRAASLQLPPQGAIAEISDPWLPGSKMLRISQIRERSQRLAWLKVPCMPTCCGMPRSAGRISGRCADYSCYAAMETLLFALEGSAAFAPLAIEEPSRELLIPCAVGLYLLLGVDIAAEAFMAQLFASIGYPTPCPRVACCQRSPVMPLTLLACHLLLFLTGEALLMEKLGFFS